MNKLLLLDDIYWLSLLLYYFYSIIIVCSSYCLDQTMNRYIAERYANFRCFLRVCNLEIDRFLFTVTGEG